jgi:hypothetical protein
MVKQSSTGPVTRGHHPDSHALLNDHLRHCVTDAARLSLEEGSHKLEEATHAIARLFRS